VNREPKQLNNISLAGAHYKCETLFYSSFNRTLTQGEAHCKKPRC